MAEIIRFVPRDETAIGISQTGRAESPAREPAPIESTSTTTQAARPPANIELRVTTDESAPSLREPSLSELYTERSALSRDLANAMHLFEQVLERLESAQQSMDRDEPFRADDEIQYLFSLLPELFCCRSIGDGFGSIVGGIFHGLSNLEGIPPSKEQIDAIQTTFMLLSRRPFMSMDQALDTLMELEDAGLHLEPRELQTLVALVDESLAPNTPTSPNTSEVG